ncbi:MAG TPA: cytochrome P450 [Chloroflexota bacterium]|nr:cytochrome P450 [Chloroflexota bacterium]
MTVNRPPGPKGHFLLGNITDFSADPPGFLLQLAQSYGGMVHFRLMQYHTYLLADSDYVREVLVAQSDKIEKAPLDRKILGQFLGNGLLTSEGAFHARQRRLAQPAFHMKRIRAYAEVMVDYTNHLLADWQDGQRRDVADDMMRLTMHIVSKTLFDADAVTETEDTAVSVGRAIHDLQAVSNGDYRRGFVLPAWMPTEGNRKRKRAIADYSQTIERIIGERRTTAVNGQIEDSGDLLSMLMLSQDEDGGFMDDRQLQDEVATLFAAGHETTSNALSWTWYLLSQNPNAEAKLHAELDEALDGRTPTLDDLPHLPYTLQVIKEAMRLYPPAWILNGRTPLTDVEIGGYTIPQGSMIFIAPYVMHRLPQHFPDPEQFLPERWTSEMEKSLPKYAYMPFGGGPRVCIGNSFAMMEAQLILATMAQRYRLRLVAGTAVQPEALITMSPASGLPMIVESRHPISSRNRMSGTAILQ